MLSENQGLKGRARCQHKPWRHRLGGQDPNRGAPQGRPQLGGSAQPCRLPRASL